MKTSDYIVKYLESKTDAVFLLPGGGIMYLVDSLGRSKKLNAYCCHHEQGAAIAAEGYSRIKNKKKIGVVLVTTGPGGTNAITGAAGAWLDSIPMVVISGQVKRDDIMPLRRNKPVIRQLGFQELNVIDLVKPITKYAVTVDNENEIRYHLEKAVFLANDGRPGPVWIEIPMDVQRTEINPSKLKRFIPKKTIKKPSLTLIKKVVKSLEKSERPLLLVGNGIRLAGGENILWNFLKKTKINVVTPIYTSDDLVTDEYPYYLGRQGIPGNKLANYAIDNCDLLLVVGERMQLTQTSYDHHKFAVQAKKIMVDIDKEELNKKIFRPDIAIHCDAKIFLEKLRQRKMKLKRWDLEKKPIISSNYAGDRKYLNVYRFFEVLNKNLGNLNLVTANGLASTSTHQAVRIKRGQRLITNAGLGHMGSGLPLAIGASIAMGKKPVVCMAGDGSIMLNLQELETVKYHQLPLKIFIFNNNGYFSVRNTHLAYFKKIFASDPKSGVSFPNFEKLIKGWGLNYQKISNDRQLYKVKQVIKTKGPVVCELMLDPFQPMLPRWEAGLLRKE